MRFRSIISSRLEPDHYALDNQYDENDEWIDDPADRPLQVIGETVGCGCCSSKEPVSAWTLELEIHKLKALIKTYEDILENDFANVQDPPISGVLPDDNDNIRGLINQGR